MAAFAYNPDDRAGIHDAAQERTPLPTGKGG